MSGQPTMIKFKDVALSHRDHMDQPSTQVALKSSDHVLYLKFNSKDLLTKATYSGSADPWLGSLCALAEGKNLPDLIHLGWKDFDEAFKDDQAYWDLKLEETNHFFFSALELLKAGIDIYRGRDYLYKETDSLICRCYGVRESDVLAYIRSSKDPTLEGLATATKAGMGCRSCVPQLTKWLAAHTPKTELRFYKEKPRAHWLLEIDYMLSCFPEALDWQMEVKSFQASQVVITFNKKVSQKEEEEVSERLQEFLGAALDSDLSFFLIRA